MEHKQSQEELMLLKIPTLLGIEPETSVYQAVALVREYIFMMINVLRYYYGDIQFW